MDFAWNLFTLVIVVIPKAGKVETFTTVLRIPAELSKVSFLNLLLCICSIALIFIWSTAKAVCSHRL